MALTQKSTPVLAPLTTFRFLAAMAIVSLHTIAQKEEYLRSGVTFFYVLSGFILTYVHPYIEHGAGKRLRFWIVRMARIWPLHLFTFAIVVAAKPFGVLLQQHLIAGTALNLFLLQAWVPISRVALSYNGVAWSLSVEVLFYALFLFLLPLILKAPLKVIALSLALTASLNGVAYVVLPENTLGNVASYQTFLTFCPLMHLYKFIFGMALGVWWMSDSRRKIGQEQRNSGLELLAFFGVLWMFPGSETLAQFLISGQTYPLASRFMQDFICVPGFGLLLYVFANQMGIISRLFSYRWFVFLGEISFSVYMIHGIVASLLSRSNFPIKSPIGWFLYVVVVIGLSTVLYLFLEKPARRGIVRLADLFHGQKAS